MFEPTARLTIFAMFSQRQSNSYQYGRAILLLATAFALLAPSTGRAASKWYDATPDVPRPADFYAIRSESDHSVCGPVLASLNKEYRIDTEKAHDFPRALLEPDSFLSSELDVTWTRKPVQQPDAQSYKITGLDVARVTWKGRTVSLFRRTLEKFSVETGALIVNRLWLSSTAPPSLNSDRTLSADDVDRLAKGTEIAVNVTGMRNIREHKNLAARQDLTEPLLINVASMKGRLFLLVIDAIQAEIAAPRATDGMVDLFVLEIISDHNIRAVCWLNST